MEVLDYSGLSHYKDKMVAWLDETKITRTELAFVSKMFKWLNERMDGQHFDVDNETGTAYALTVPTGAKAVSVNKIGGHSGLWNQLVVNGNFQTTESWEAIQSTIAIANNTAAVTATVTSSASILYRKQFPAGHKLYARCEINCNSSTVEVRMGLNMNSINTNNIGAVIGKTEFAKISGIVTGSNAGTAATDAIRIGSTNATTSVGITYYVKNVAVVDLTLLFGSGNEPSTTDDPRIDAIEAYIDDHQEYNAGELVSASVTDVVSRDSSNTTLGTLTIPSQLLIDHPLHSAGTVYDEYDFERMKFVQRVNLIADLSLLEWSQHSASYPNVKIANIPTGNGVVANEISNYTPTSAWSVARDNSGYLRIFNDTVTVNTGSPDDNPLGYLSYVLATPIETDISSYFAGDLEPIAAESGGTVTFEQEDTSFAVPYDLDLAIKLAEVSI